MEVLCRLSSRLAAHTCEWRRTKPSCARQAGGWNTHTCGFGTRRQQHWLACQGHSRQPCQVHTPPTCVAWRKRRAARRCAQATPVSHSTSAVQRQRCGGVSEAGAASEQARLLGGPPCTRSHHFTGHLSASSSPSTSQPPLLPSQSPKASPPNPPMMVLYTIASGAQPRARMSSKACAQRGKKGVEV